MLNKGLLVRVPSESDVNEVRSKNSVNEKFAGNDSRKKFSKKEAPFA